MYTEKEVENTAYKQTVNRSDEVDIRVLLIGLNHLGSSIGNGIRYLIRAVLKRKGTVILFILLGLAVGYLAFYFTKPYYKSSMTLVLADFRNQFVEDHLNKLSLMVKDDNYEALSDRLKISVEEAKQIKKMTFSNLDEERISEDSVLTGSPFRIELMLYDNGLFDNMEESITEYLENNRYFSKQKLIRQRELEGLIRKYKEDISSIDSIKTAVASLRGPANGFVYGEPLDPTNLYKESVNMYQQQAYLESELEKLTNVEIVVGFAPQSKPTWPILPIFLGFGAGAGLLFALITVLILEKQREQIA